MERSQPSSDHLIKYGSGPSVVVWLWLSIVSDNFKLANFFIARAWKQSVGNSKKITMMIHLTIKKNLLYASSSFAYSYIVKTVSNTMLTNTCDPKSEA